jgi:hypothetical protein
MRIVEGKTKKGKLESPLASLLQDAGRLSLAGVVVAVLIIIQLI